MRFWAWLGLLANPSVCQNFCDLVLKSALIYVIVRLHNYKLFRNPWKYTISCVSCIVLLITLNWTSGAELGQTQSSLLPFTELQYSAGLVPRANFQAQLMNKILFVQKNIPQMAWNVQFFLQAWAEVWNKIIFFRKKLWYSPNVLKRPKICFTLFLWDRAWRKMLSEPTPSCRGMGLLKHLEDLSKNKIESLIK